MNDWLKLFIGFCVGLMVLLIGVFSSNTWADAIGATFMFVYAFWAALKWARTH